MIKRRNFLAGGACASTLLIAGCSSSIRENNPIARFREQRSAKQSFASLYGPLPNEEFPIPAVPKDGLDPKFFRQRVDYKTSEKPGTVIVDTQTFYLHLVEDGGTAMRYGVGLGRQGFEWSGRAKVQWKRPWPTWTPPEEMIEREPELEKYSAENGGMEPGLKNPLGARALYIFQNGVDTLYRLHGTPEHWSIGKAVSSGCVRLINQDVVDLYDRVRPGSDIIVT